MLLRTACVQWMKNRSSGYSCKEPSPSYTLDWLTVATLYLNVMVIYVILTNVQEVSIENKPDAQQAQQPYIS
jgi:hypothetical protein